MKKERMMRGLALLLVVVLSAFLLAGCTAAAPGSSELSSTVSSEIAVQKSFTLTVVHRDGSEKEFALTTERQYLGAELQAAGLIDGEEGQYGLFIKTVDGETADDSKQEWWCLKKDGEMTETGIDTTPITDGDKFELTLTVGY